MHRISQLGETTSPTLVPALCPFLSGDSHCKMCTADVFWRINVLPAVESICQARAASHSATRSHVSRAGPTTPSDFATLQPVPTMHRTHSMLTPRAGRGKANRYRGDWYNETPFIPYRDIASTTGRLVSFQIWYVRTLKLALLAPHTVHPDGSAI